METTGKSIFDNTYILGNALKNRLVVAPMTRWSADDNGVPTREMTDYYEAFARGGFGMIISEGTYTDALFSQSDLRQPGISNRRQMEGWKRVVERVHAHGACIVSQLMHAGALRQMSNHTIAPSAVRPVGTRVPEHGGLTGPFPVPAEMSLADMADIQAGYVRAAQLAVEAGFDGIEIHAANGYVFDQFITPHTNLRTDAYGGGTRNRLRFLMEVYRAIKISVPAGFMVGIRISESKVNDLTYRWPGGSETARSIFGILAEIDPDYVHIAAEGGRWDREALYPDGLSSTGIAKSLLRSPVIANGGMHDVALAQSLLNSGQADLVSIGRAAIANPDWPRRVAAGEPVVPFFKALITPSITLEHAQKVMHQFRQPLV